VPRQFTCENVRRAPPQKCRLKSLRTHEFGPVRFPDGHFTQSSPVVPRGRSRKGAIWYVFFTAVVSFRRIVFGESILSNRLRHRRSTFNYDWDTLIGPPQPRIPRVSVCAAMVVSTKNKAKLT